MSIKINILTDFNGKALERARKEFAALETNAQKAGFVIKKAMLPATAALGALAVAAKDVVGVASDLREAQDKVNVIFGDGAKDIEEFSKSASKNIGQSRRSVLQAAGTFGAFGKAAGLSGQDLAKFSNDFTALASDLASFNNTTPEDAIQAIGAALRGEAEPMRRYQVLLDDAALKQAALELKIYDGNGALTAQQKILAAQKVIFDQTADAQGNFLDTSDGLANSSRTLSAQIDDLKGSIGEGLLPVVEDILPSLKTFAEWAKNNPTPIRNVAIAVGGLAAATVALNAAMAVNPYVLVAAAIVAVGVAADKALQPLERMTGPIGAVARFLGRGLLGDIGDVFGTSAKATEGLSGLSKAAIENREVNQLLSAGIIDVNKLLGGLSTNLGGVGGSSSGATSKIKELTKSIRSDFKSALDQANDVLKNARARFNDFAKSVATSITSAFSFRDAKNAAKETGGSFIGELTKQAQKAQDFGVLVNRLLAAGLSEQALQQVLAAGVDAGSEIAQELLNGGAAVIQQANSLTASVQSLGENVGKNAATQFYQGGVDAGNALVAGINQVVSQFKLKLSSKGLTDRQLARLQRRLGIEVDFLLQSGGIPALADGGIVTGPTLALIGEAGPEAVVPLDRAGGMGGNTVNINVQGADPNAVVDALRTYMLRNGSVPIRVS